MCVVSDVVLYVRSRHIINHMGAIDMVLPGGLEGKLIKDLRVADHHHKPKQGDHHLIHHSASVSSRRQGDHPHPSHSN